MQFVTLYEAIHMAQLAADVYGLSQTVYRRPETYGWTHTSIGARFLSDKDTDVHVTMIPRGYFE